MRKEWLFFLGLGCATINSAQADQVGSVDTVFKLVGPDHKIVVEAFDDPDVKNVTCYISRAKTGGVKGGLGLAEDTADAAISCQQVGPIALSDKIINGNAEGSVVFQKRTSLVFKKLQVVRFYDAKRNTLVYLSYSDRVVDGSPKNALSAVPIIPWGEVKYKSGSSKLNSDCFEV
ncbi:protein CreA [Serratia symbiotica]|nr:protein CreA [Serratia symbiotica]